jgi:hypothetical protein
VCGWEVGVVSMLRAGRSGVRIAVEARCYSLLQNVQTGSGAQPAYSLGTGVVSLVVKRPGREFDHSPASNIEVKNEWRHTSPSPV